MTIYPQDKMKRETKMRITNINQLKVDNLITITKNGKSLKFRVIRHWVYMPDNLPVISICRTTLRKGGIKHNYEYQTYKTDYLMNHDLKYKVVEILSENND